MSTTVNSQLEAIHAMMASGHRSVRMERHTLLIWGVASAFLIIMTDYLFTSDRFAEHWQRAVAESVFISVTLFLAGFWDFKLTRRARKKRDETLSFVQVQVTKIWWFLIGLIVVLNLGMNFFGGGYMIYGLVLVFIGLAFYVQGLFSQQMLSWIGVLMITIGLCSVSFQLPYPAMKWLAAFTCGLGMPLLGFVIDKPHTHSTIWRKAILSFAWVLIVVVPTVFAFQFTGQFSESSLPHVSLQQYTNGAAISGKQIVSIPAGTIIPMDVTVTGNVLGNTDTTRFPLRLTQPVDVVVEDGKPTGVYRVGQTAEKEKWLRVHTSMRIKDFKMESKLNNKDGPQVAIKFSVKTN